MIYATETRAREVAADLNTRPGELKVEAAASEHGWIVTITQPLKW